ncbi:hypothetical protein [Acidocella aminolytica]|uniref:Uncharacterized protein n=1 Tax=Acidocella aminolytica 101 = DSM 11237 TaxID=1120923 RepID=A0A0D6PH49_9PROT|nr:hypothetical protein [Acidocella aminolytica]GAN80997.1 hypothetical protein Aam_068_004 [Acidocella aminolytica 101 = DSM 11237]SHF62734.1 hypothetical protein SAMN02746095_03908 [Acidocella aminolytica 101 = DSM 11237]
MNSPVFTPTVDVLPFRRLPDQVLKLDRMGAAHPTRLSFLRQLLRRIEAEGWRFDNPLWDIDDKGVGRAIYRAIGPVRTYSLVAFPQHLPDEMRSDRVIATAWDATFVLFDGDPSPEDITRLEANVPLQEAGRITQRELSLSRANRSVRLFAHVVERLSQGIQPDQAKIDAVGYLMRTTAVYGAGKFGAADRSVIADREELRGPFQAEMLSVWLIRSFCADLVEHLAAAKGGAKAVRLDRAIRRTLGVGNSTGLGMAPFLVRHPVLLNNWMLAREEALARVRAQTNAKEECVRGLHDALAEAQRNVTLWRSEHPIQISRLSDLRADLTQIAEKLNSWPQRGANPWDDLWRWGESSLTLEGQEALLALMLEPHGELIDNLGNTMSAEESIAMRIDGAMTIGNLRRAICDQFQWALEIDFADPENTARFWYVSEEKLEPRLGDRHCEEGAALEQPLCIARLVKDLHEALQKVDDGIHVAAFLMRCPEHRYAVRRVQISIDHPFAEVHDNLIKADMLPIDLMRCKLAFFGASRFDPRSDKWVRISLFQDTPYPDEFLGRNSA